MGTVEEKAVVHSWPKMKRYEPSEEDFLMVTEGGIANIIEVLSKLKPNEYFPVITMVDGVNYSNFRTTSNKEHNLFMDTEVFQEYLERLREQGLDVGHGDHEYGYKMPLPKNGANSRELIIFRRR